MNVSEVKDYLTNYPHTLSNAMDNIFPMNKSDVSRLADEYRSGEAYLYSTDEYLDELEETLENNIAYHISTGLDKEEAMAEESQLIRLIDDINHSSKSCHVDTVAEGYLLSI